MPDRLIRLISLLLVSCLLAQPLLAAAHGVWLTGSERVLPLTRGVFQQQALAAEPMGEQRPAAAYFNSTSLRSRVAVVLSAPGFMSPEVHQALRDHSITTFVLACLFSGLLVGGVFLVFYFWHPGSARNQPSVNGEGKPLLPFLYEGSAVETGERTAHREYPVLVLEDGRRVISKYRAPVDRSLDRVLLRARAHYEMAAVVGFADVNAVQIYIDRTKQTSSLEEEFGQPVKQVLNVHGLQDHDLSEVLGLWQESPGIAYQRILGIPGLAPSFVRGDIYRLFSNNLDDSYHTRNIRMASQDGHSVMRWIDYDNSFIWDDRYRALITRYLTQRRVDHAEHGGDLIAAIARLSNRQIARVGNRVYGKEARKAFAKSLPDSSLWEAWFIHQAAKWLSWWELRSKKREFIRSVKARRDVFRDFYLERPSPDGKTESIAGRFFSGHLGPFWGSLADAVWEEPVFRGLPLILFTLTGCPRGISSSISRSCMPRGISGRSGVLAVGETVVGERVNDVGLHRERSMVAAF